MSELGPWDGARATLAARVAPRTPAAGARRAGLATWKQMLDHGSMQDGDQHLRATARLPVARVSRGGPTTPAGPTVTLTGDRGSVTLPAEVADIVEGVVWVPANSVGHRRAGRAGLARQPRHREGSPA